MSSYLLRCRKCRNILLSNEELIPNEEPLSCLPASQIFVNEEQAPSWIRESLEQGQYTKGKLNCPTCHGRVGAFDYVSHIPCQCGQHSLPHLRVLSDRVDKSDRHASVRIEFLRTKHPVPKKVPTYDAGNCGHSSSADLNLSRHRDLSDEGSELVNAYAHGENLEYNEIEGEKVSQNGVHTDSNMLNSSNGHNFVNDVTSDTPSTLLCDNHLVSGNSLENFTEVTETLSTPEQVEGANYSSDVPEEVMSSSDQDLPEKDHLICAVCLELFYLPQTVRPCKHIYCDPCLRQLNASTLGGQSIKCPMCRVKIKSCKPHREYTATINYYFSGEHEIRRQAEKKNKYKKFPLPSALPASVRQRRLRREASHQLSILAGVCFVVMLIFLGFTIFAITVGFVSWYLLEVAMDLVVDLAVELHTLCDLLRSVIIFLCIDGSLKEEYIHALFNSSTRVLMAFAKVVSTPQDTEGNHYDNVKTLKAHMAERTDQLLTKMTQAAIANYVVVGAIVTYAVYKLAKYMQQIRANR